MGNDITPPVDQWVSQENIRIAKRLENLRSSLNIPRDELAQLAHIHPNTLKQYENGTESIPASDLMLFAQILGIPTEYFYKQDDHTSMIQPAISEKIVYQ